MTKKEGRSAWLTSATCFEVVRLCNPLHPYSFLRFIYPRAPEAKWLILFSHELEVRDFVRETGVWAGIFGLAAPPIAFLPDADAAARECVLHDFGADKIRGLACAVSGALQPCPSLAGLLSRQMMIKTEASFPREDLIGRLLEFGLRRTDAVESVGEFAARGQVLDIFPATTEQPVRLLFNLDVIECIRFFDIETQISGEFLRQALILPVTGASSGSLQEYFSPSFCVAAENEDIFKEAPAWTKEGRSWIFSSSDHNESLPITSNVSYGGNVALFLREAASLAERGYGIHIVSATIGDEQRAKEVIKERGRAAERQSGGEYESAGDNAPALPRSFAPPLRLSASPPHTSQWRWSVGAIGAGIRDDANRLWVVNSAELFSRIPVKISAPPHILSRRKRSKQAGETFQETLIELKLGDFVVHEVYGIARYRGMERIFDMENKPLGEFIKLEYAKGDKLYVNPEDMHWLHKYASLGARQIPRLSHLDARSFNEIKSRVREEARKFCEKLLALWAKRQALPASGIEAVSKWEEEFSASFPFEETEDQNRAIQEVLADMEKPKPMERLLLGDVGFGKTEVALRAAFRAAANGRQAVVLAPTTVLADQHYRNFNQRLESYPIKVGLFSRFTAKSEIRRQLHELAQGKLDIAVGTHRLLQKDVRFKDLGLLIIDEEHRFGVRDKERLKFLSSQAHALYLSATPIPRTLSAALSGFKNISVIESPPLGRLPIETMAGPWQAELVERAIRHEIARGGQVFYVLNDISRLPDLAGELEAMIKGIKTAVCHGQMGSAAIEKTMENFLNKEIDVLAASSIIESGLDIPSVNTLIIEEAQDFGLAQLYQIRGRIGRKDAKAYAYFFYPRGKKWDDLSATAKERLSAIRDFVELGSGMRLALRDLEIRGAGEILGLKQHGFVSKVGIELYSKLLAEEMESLKSPSDTPSSSFFPSPREAGRGQGEGVWPKIHLNFPAYLPDELLPSEMERVSYYRRLSRCRSEKEIGQIFTEIQDRAGSLPQEAQNLKIFFNIRLAAQKAGFSVIEQLAGGLVRFEFGEAKTPKGAIAAWLLKEFPGKVRFEHDRQAFRLEMADSAVPEALIGVLRATP
ncbi:MAG: DEAD/DEAH box helicase [Elusimicrobia bacterium]|nr:DEAD/DEAH box helicase [Elusimicrobiota bacterium]